MSTLQLLTGAAGVIGGTLLVVRPDGSLLAAKVSALQGTPFSDWRAPGLLLAVLVGGGGLATGCWLLAGRRQARALSVLYGFGMLSFEMIEASWIGFQPLEVVFGLVALSIVALAVRSPEVTPPLVDEVELGRSCRDQRSGDATVFRGDRSRH